MHRALGGSKMIALCGRFRHGGYLVAGDARVDATVNRYLLAGSHVPISWTKVRGLIGLGM
jgi:hypothetical protein